MITGILGMSVFSLFNKANVEVSTGYTSQVVNNGMQIMKSNSFESELETLNSTEIERYLASNGQDINASLVALVSDENILPAAEDYLINENTLDELLNKLNLNNLTL